MNGGRAARQRTGGRQNGRKSEKRILRCRGAVKITALKKCKGPSSSERLASTTQEYESVTSSNSAQEPEHLRRSPHVALNWNIHNLGVQPINHSPTSRLTLEIQNPEESRALLEPRARMTAELKFVARRWPLQDTGFATFPIGNSHLNPGGD